MTVAQLEEAKPASGSFMALAKLDQEAMDALPQAVYLCAADGRVVRFNRKAVELWGRTPKLGSPEERFCGSFRLYQTDGTLLPHDQCPMAVSLLTGDSFHDREVVVEQPSGQQLTVLVNIAAFKDGKGQIKGAINCFQDVSERKREENRLRLLVEELEHRNKNMFAIVHSMAANTARSATSVEEFASRFEARLLALGQAHALFSDSGGADAKLHDLLLQQLEPFVSGEKPRVRFDGPEVDLQPRAALALSMVFHELVTNAAKYGAFSVSGGRISVKWELRSGAEDDRTLTLQWVEIDGPPVEAPQRTGFGTRLIKRTIAGGLGGQANLHFEPSGLRFLGSIPLQN